MNIFRRMADQWRGRRFRLLRWLWRRWKFRSLSAAQRKALEWLWLSEALTAKMDRHRRLLAAERDRVRDLYDSVAADVEEYEALQKQQQNVVESLQNELKILSDVVVPFLTQQHRAMLERVEAEIAVQVRRQVAATPEINRGE